MPTIHFGQTTTGARAVQRRAYGLRAGPLEAVWHQLRRGPQGAFRDRVLTPTSLRARAASGNARTTTGPIRIGSSAKTIDSEVWGSDARDGTTHIDYGESKNLKGRLLGVVLGTVGKRILA